MRLSVDTEVCIAAGTCVEHLPAVFTLEEGAEHVTLLNDGIVPEGFGSRGSVEHRGQYYNSNYCFSVVIPEGVVGRSDPPPAPPPSLLGFAALAGSPE